MRGKKISKVGGEEQNATIPASNQKCLLSSKPQRYMPLLDEIYDKFCRCASLAMAIENGSMDDVAIIVTSEMIKNISEMGKRNCASLELLIHTLPSQAGQ